MVISKHLSHHGLRLIECTLGPLLTFSGPVIIWPEKEFKELTAAFVRCNKEAWQISLNTSTALFTFPKDLGGLQIKLPRAIFCSATWGHLTRCCQFDDGTQQLAEITLREEEDAASEFPSILKLLIKKINITGNNPPSSGVAFYCECSTLRLF